MSAGSDASNLGYGEITPVLGSTNNPANFSSNEIPGLPGLAGAKSNIDAAAGKVPGICMKGGRGGKWLRSLKKRVKKIVSQYRSRSRQSRSSMKSRSQKRMIARMLSARRSRSRSMQRRRSVRRTVRRSRSRHQRGGYAQFQNNLPMTNTYATGSINLNASESALANPVPFTALSNCTNCVDNYNHMTNMGFASKGH